MATFFLSPLVYVKETDLTGVIRGAATSITATVGIFQKGPVDEATLITQERELIDVFGYPDSDNYISWYTAWNFLQYGQLLWITRVVNKDGVTSSLALTLAIAGGTIYVGDTSDFPATGKVVVGSEIISYSAKSDITNTLTVSNRAVAGTTDAEHVIGETVTNFPENASIDVYSDAAPVTAGVAAQGKFTLAAPEVHPNHDYITISDGIKTATFELVGGDQVGDTDITATFATDHFNSDRLMTLGEPVVFHDGTGTAPAGLTSGTTYFVTEVNVETAIGLANSFKVATTLALAIAGTEVTVTDAGLVGWHMYHGDVVSTVDTPEISIPLNTSAMAINTLDETDLATDFGNMVNALYKVKVVDTTAFWAVPMHEDTANCASSNATGTGIVRYKEGSYLYVQVTAGGAAAFAVNEYIEAAASYSGPGGATRVISSERVLDMTAVVATAGVTLTNDNSDDGASLGNVPFANPTLAVDGVATSFTIDTEMGVLAIGTEPVYVTEDYMTIYDLDSGPVSTLVWNANSAIKFFAQSVGALKNNLAVAVSTPATFTTDYVYGDASSGISFIGQFEYAPTTAAREVAIAVVEYNEKGQPDVVEKFLCSLDPDVKDASGLKNFVEDVVNRQSRYIYAYVNPTLQPSTATAYPANVTAKLLTGGFDGYYGLESVKDEIMIAWDYFADTENIDINLAVDGCGADDSTIQKYIIDTVAEGRKDTVAILTVPWASVNYAVVSQQLNAMVDYRNNDGVFLGTGVNTNSNYTALYGNWKYQYDKYTDEYRWLPISGDIAGIYANNDNVADVWDAPAGFIRGVMKNVQKFKVKPKQGHRDLMYVNQINPVLEFKGDGPIVFGQKTMQVRPSAFDRVNVRRLFIMLEKAIATAAKYKLFEINDRFTRTLIKVEISSFLEYIKSRGGITDFHVECSELNNPAQVIMNNELHCDIYIKPVYVIEFLVLNFVAVRLDANFQELVRANI